MMGNACWLSLVVGTLPESDKLAPGLLAAALADELPGFVPQPDIEANMIKTIIVRAIFVNILAFLSFIGI
jgi:hypothetical protein